MPTSCWGRFARSPLARLSIAGVLLGVCAAGAWAQGGAIISGAVTDVRSRQGIAGASVFVERTRLGAVADQDGRYRIVNVPPGTHAVVARFLGYAPVRRSVTVAAGQEFTLDFALQQAAISLEEVVVTGTAGGEQRRSIGNSVATLNAPQQLSQSSAPDLGSLLNARAPGVVIAPSSSRLGAGPDIEVRGRSSISLENAPLLYIDGVRVNNAIGTGPSNMGFGSQGAAVAGRLNDINPDDIERIEIIKGPAAATIYGTEAANGVIQVITKRGAADAKPRLEARIQQGAIWFRNPEGRVPTNFMPDENGNVVAWNGVQTEADLGTPIFKDGQTRLYNVSLSGGRDPLQYYLATAYENDDGIEPNNSLRQFSAHANLAVAPTSKVDVSTSLNYVDRSAHLGADFGVSPLLGAEVGHVLLFPEARGFFPGWPPEIPQQLYDNSQSVNRFTGSLTVNHRPLGWLSHRLIGGIDYTNEDNRGLERFAPPELAAFLPPIVAAGQINQILRQYTLFSADYSATARVNLTPRISSATSVGGQYYRTEMDTSSLGGMQFPGPGVEAVSGTAQQVAATQDRILNTTIGAYGQEQFGLNDRLFLTAALRVDNNSAFGEDFKWVTYPKVSAAWVVNEEPFWRWTKAVNVLKLRAAYGESGRQPAALSALRTFTPVPGRNGVSAITPGSIGNPDLKPERGREFEVGFEAGLFNRLNLDFTFFTKRTTDEIIQQPVSPSTGFAGDQFRNIGRVDNHGIELQASYQALARENVGWEIVGSIATNRNEIKSLGSLTTVIAPGQNNVVGYPIYSYFAKRVVSADRDPATGFATNALCDGGAGQAPVPCEDAPLVFIGTPTPKVSGSVSNTLTLFKRLRLYGLVDFKRGHKLYNAVEELRCTSALGVGLCDANYHPERYSPLYLAEFDAVAALEGLNDQFIQDASFVKLREISATYTLPSRWTFGLSEVSVSLAARELHTWTDYRGIDPEVAQVTSSRAVDVLDQAVTPPLSRFIATVHVVF